MHHHPSSAPPPGRRAVSEDQECMAAAEAVTRMPCSTMAPGRIPHYYYFFLPTVVGPYVEPRATDGSLTKGLFLLYLDAMRCTFRTSSIGYTAHSYDEHTQVA